MQWHTGHKQYRQGGLELYKHGRSLLVCGMNVCCLNPGLTWSCCGASSFIRPACDLRCRASSLQLQCGAEGIRKWHGHYQEDISFADEIPLAEDHGFSMPFSRSRRYDSQERSHGYVLEAAHKIPGSDRRRKLLRLMFAEPCSGVDTIIP